jgi:hypothetical protein
VVVVGGPLNWIVFVAPLGVVISVNVPGVAPAVDPSAVVDAATSAAIVSRRDERARIEAPKWCRIVAHRSAIIGDERP